jgi:uroporphyrinogen-III synthase
MREVPLQENLDAIKFASELLAGEIDVVIFLTGVGTRYLTKVAETKYTRDEWIQALSRITVIARGPKPIAALKELGVPVTLSAPEPNTWHELMSALDRGQPRIELSGRKVAVQEYGVPNNDLIAALTARGALVRPVRVYQWALPEDTVPLRAAIERIAAGEVDVVIFTTSVQAVHVMQVASEMGLADGLRESLLNAVIASIGPTTSETLRSFGIEPDLEPSHPKMGILVNETAAKSRSLLTSKRKS